MSSKLGWLLVGPVSNSESDVSDCISNLVIEGNSPYDTRKNEDQELVQTLKRFWEIEQYGVEDNLDKRTDEFYDSLTGGENNFKVMKLMCLFQVKRNRSVLTILILSLKENVMKWVSHGGMT